MPITADQLAAFVNATDAASRQFVTECAIEAPALITPYLATEPPASVLERAQLEVGADLFHRKKARNGVTAFDTADGGETVRINRDPLAAAWPIIRPYLAPGIA